MSPIEIQSETAAERVLVAVFPGRSDVLIVQVASDIRISELEVRIADEYKRVFPKNTALHPKNLRIMKRFVTNDVEMQFSQSNILSQGLEKSFCLVDVGKSVHIDSIFEPMERIFVLETNENDANSNVRKRPVSDAIQNGVVEVTAPKKKKSKEPKAPTEPSVRVETQVPKVVKEPKTPKVAQPNGEREEKKKKHKVIEKKSNENTQMTQETKTNAEPKKKRKANKPETKENAKEAKSVIANAQKKNVAEKKSKAASKPETVSKEKSSSKPSKSSAQESNDTTAAPLKLTFKDRLDAAIKRVAEEKQVASEPSTQTQTTIDISSTSSTESDTVSAVKKTSAIKSESDGSTSDETSDDETQYQKNLLADITKNHEQFKHTTKSRTQPQVPQRPVSSKCKKARSSTFDAAYLHSASSIGSVLTPTLFKSSFSLQGVEVKALTPSSKNPFASSRTKPKLSRKSKAGTVNSPNHG